MAIRDLPLAGGAESDDLSATGITLLALVVDGGRATIDPGALHGRSDAERGIAFSADPDAAPEGRMVHVVWIGIRAGADGRDGYFSAVACPERIDAARRIGWRPDSHFGDMILAIQGAIRTGALSDAGERDVRAALAAHDEGMWQRRSGPLRRMWPA